MIATFAISSYAYAPKITPQEGSATQTTYTSTRENKQLIDAISASNELFHTLPDTEKGYKQAIALVGAQYGKVLYNLANCESGFKDLCIIDTNGKQSCGIFMFQEETFLGNCTGQWHNMFDQVKCASEMVSKGLGSIHWKNCWAKIEK